MIKFWSYQKEYRDNKSTFTKLFNNTLVKGQIFFGNNLKNFEKNYKKKYKAKEGVAVGSGTDALLISIMALGIKKGDEIITAANTAIPTISAIVNSGATPKLVDVGDDYLIDPLKIEKIINNNTKAIIPVHLYGKSCNMDDILKISKKYKLKVIEDCAQSQGAKFKKKFTGTFGNCGCFSFYPTKILGAYGDGGLILTNDFNLYQNAKKIRFYGIDTVNKKNKFLNKYYSNINGVNSRLDEINSKILDYKLKKVDVFIKRRRIIANQYYRLLKNTSLILPKKEKEKFDVYHLYTVYHPKRDFIIRQLYKNNIETRIIYPYPIHKMTAYKSFFKKKKFINSEKMSKGIFSLPLYPDLKMSDVKIVCNKLVEILKKIS